MKLRRARGLSLNEVVREILIAGRPKTVPSGVDHRRESGSRNQSAGDFDLTDPAREFVCSDWVKLEVLPKARFFRKTSELALYDLYFGRVAIWMSFTPGLIEEALAEASLSGLSAVDAIHIVLAASSACHELVTSEKPTSPIHRTHRIRVVSLTAERG
jgi:hypothetical protein